MSHKLILLGCGETAEVMYEYFTYDSEYDVVAFSVNQQYIEQTNLDGLPIVPFETLETHFPPKEYSFFAAISSTKLNRVRTSMYLAAKSKGYAPASYISSKAMVMPSAKIGEHTFIFEGNVIQPFVTIGNNVILWSSNHIGHRAVIADNCFIASHVVVSGFSKIGFNTFIGVNSTIADDIEIGKDCFVGAGSVITKDLLENSITKPKAINIVDGARILSHIN